MFHETVGDQRKKKYKQRIYIKKKGAMPYFNSLDSAVSQVFIYHEQQHYIGEENKQSFLAIFVT